MTNGSITKTINSALKELTDRQREVIGGRFGLNGKKPETLESIGRRNDITRERVRQIEAGALEMLQAKLATDPSFKSFVEHARKHLKNAGGALREDAYIAELAKVFKDLNKPYLTLAARASNAFLRYNEDDTFHPFYHIDNASYKTAFGFVQDWHNTLNVEKEHIIQGKYHACLKEFVKGKKVAGEHAENYLALSKGIHQNAFGDVGLADWPEIKPKTVRDKIYLVLKKQGKPLHFEAIAKAINESGLNHRIALASTVHNELIKDKRFVLVGRGLYGLSEQGYEPGTAREVIHRILKKHGPMTAREVVDAVQRERFFKYNTILVNLQNKNFFGRDAGGNYMVREA